MPFARSPDSMTTCHRAVWFSFSLPSPWCWTSAIRAACIRTFQTYLKIYFKRLILTWLEALFTISVEMGTQKLRAGAPSYSLTHHIEIRMGDIQVIYHDMLGGTLQNLLLNACPAPLLATWAIRNSAQLSSPHLSMSFRMTQLEALTCLH